MTLSTKWKQRGAALALGTVGGALFFTFHLPLAWLLGSLSACLIATLLGVKLQGPGIAVPVLRVVLGLAVGAAFTPALFGRLGEIGLSLALIPPFVVVIGSLGYAYYRKIGGYDRTTAFYAAMPGGFQDMMAMGEDRGAHLSTLGLIHATRVVVLVFLLPFLINWLGGLDLGERSAVLIGVWPDAKGILTLFACGAVGWWAATRLGISGAAVIGPMAASAIVHLAGISEAKPPMLLINMAQLFIGIYVGCQYQGSTIRQIVKVVGLSLG
ncbi:MAG: AbrB family transcriptional regulator, partial [Rhodospirillales bacterium]|nr:AbrB family transcriptional regulator [Rhodospirillales bacterium]